MSQLNLLTMDTICPAVKAIQYAVRGKQSYRAAELEEELKNVLLFYLY